MQKIKFINNSNKPFYLFQNDEPGSIKIQHLESNLPKNLLKLENDIIIKLNNLNYLDNEFIQNLKKRG